LRHALVKTAWKYAVLLEKADTVSSVTVLKGHVTFVPPLRRMTGPGRTLVKALHAPEGEITSSTSDCSMMASMTSVPRGLIHSGCSGSVFWAEALWNVTLFTQGTRSRRLKYWLLKLDWSPVQPPSKPLFAVIVRPTACAPSSATTSVMLRL